MDQRQFALDVGGLRAGLAHQPGVPVRIARVDRTPPGGVPLPLVRVAIGCKVTVAAGTTPRSTREVRAGKRIDQDRVLWSIRELAADGPLAGQEADTGPVQVVI